MVQEPPYTDQSRSVADGSNPLEVSSGYLSAARGPTVLSLLGIGFTIPRGIRPLSERDTAIVRSRAVTEASGAGLIEAGRDPETQPVRFVGAIGERAPRGPGQSGWRRAWLSRRASTREN